MAQGTEPALSSSPTRQENDAPPRLPALPLEIQLEIASCIPLGLDSLDAAEWADLHKYLLVCKAWMNVLRKRISRTVPLKFLAMRNRDHAIVYGAVKRCLAHARTLPKAQAREVRSEAAVHVTAGAHPRSLRLLLNSGADPNYLTPAVPGYSTLLHLACQRRIPRDVDADRLQCVRVLLEKGAFPGLRCYAYGHKKAPVTPLAIAMTEDQTDIAIELINRNRGISVSTGAHQESPFYLAAHRGNWPILSKLLEHRKPGHLEESVRAAVEGSLLDILDKLLEHYLSIEDAEGWDITPLEMAVRAKSIPMVRRLVKAGADIKNRELIATALKVEASRDLLRTLIELEAPITPEIWPLMMISNTTYAYFLLDHLPELNAQTIMNECITGPGNGDVLALCLKYGADPNIPIGNAPCLTICIQRRPYEECRAILEAGADPNPPVPYTLMPIYAAVVNGFHAKMQLLEQFGASWDKCPEAKAYREAHPPLQGILNYSSAPRPPSPRKRASRPPPPNHTPPKPAEASLRELPRSMDVVAASQLAATQSVTSQDQQREQDTEAQTGTEVNLKLSISARLKRWISSSEIGRGG